MDLADCCTLIHMADQLFQKQTHTLKYFGACFDVSLHFVLQMLSILLLPLVSFGFGCNFNEMY